MTDATRPTRKPRRCRTVGVNTPGGDPPPLPIGPATLTPEQEAENAGTQALIRAFGAISDCGKVAPLDQTIGIAMEALAFVAGGEKEGRSEAVRRRIGEMKGELIGLLWEG